MEQVSLTYWKTNVAGLDDVNLLRFLAAVQQRRNKYATALEAAAYEARRRRLLPDEKGRPEGPPSLSREDAVSVTQRDTDGK